MRFYFERPHGSVLHVRTFHDPKQPSEFAHAYTRLPYSANRPSCFILDGIQRVGVVIAGGTYSYSWGATHSANVSASTRLSSGGAHRIAAACAIAL